MSTPLSNKPLIAGMEDDDTFLIVTEDGGNRRIKKSALNLSDLAGITDAYLNDVGEMILVIGDGGGGEEPAQEIAVLDVNMYVNIVRNLGSYAPSVTDATPADALTATVDGVTIHTVRSLGAYTTAISDAISDALAATNINMEVIAA